MNSRDNLRPVEVLYEGKKSKGYFHRFIYSHSKDFSETKVLVELENGKLRIIDPYFVQFVDRKELKNVRND